MPSFHVVSPFEPTGDQPQAIEKLAAGLREGLRFQTLLGVTGSGKTFTVAKVVESVQRPTLVLAPNKTLAAQLYAEFREFFPENAVEYFVSYYDYYQPEAYVPQTDTYIEKDADINEEIDKLRHAATRAILTRRDVVIVASVSCIYGLGSPAEYEKFVIYLAKGEKHPRQRVLRRLVEMQYERNDMEIARAKFRVRGDTLELQPAYDEIAIRIEFFGDEVERILRVDPVTGEFLGEVQDISIYPAKHWVTSQDKLTSAVRTIEQELAQRMDALKAGGKVLEAARLEQRTRHDMEMLREMGYCPGIENYSRHLDGRAVGTPPWTLLDYFPDDFLLVIDESHMTVPQVRGMYHGDMARKQTLVDFGFRLPSAMDNRPLSFDEFNARTSQVVFTSATPGPYELGASAQVVEQLVRPTGLLDPTIEVKPTHGQIDDLLHQIKLRVQNGQRALVTTLTMRMAEELADYLREMGVKVHHLHAEIETLQRTEILRDLRLGIYDVVVGINLLREGLDLPEVSLIAILDADKEGYLRSATSLIQTTGRAARHLDGHVIMYADTITASMRKAIDETYRRRGLQQSYNEAHGITPQSIRKAIRDITDRVKTMVAEEKEKYTVTRELPKEEMLRLVHDLERQMKDAAKQLEFEKAALLRDQIVDIRKLMEEDRALSLGAFGRKERARR
ncbi:MAG: excinuclease ABC subunit UvrB [Dehalococcoidia bacterium]|nr:excinuclease ABC subunit UvrB [Dehalococcoidia bacterium]